MHEDRAAADPLAVEFAPSRLRPAGIRHRVVQSAIAHVLPELGRHNVAQRIRKIVRHHLRLPGGARRKIDQHGVVIACGRFAGWPLPTSIRRLHSRGKIEPPLPPALQPHFERPQRLLRSGVINRGLQGGIGDRQHQPDARPLKTVFQIVFRQHVRGRYANRAQLMQPQQRMPKFQPPLQNQQHRIAFANPMTLKNLRCAIAAVFQVRKRDIPFVARIVAPHHGPASGLRAGIMVHDVISKIE